LAAAGAAAVAVLLAGGTGGTYAQFTDFQVVHAEARAGVWAPDPPAACGPVSDYSGVVYGTASDDNLTGGSHPQIIMGLGGNDVIHGGNGGDCLVGGDGNDRLLGENAKDILIGGDGDDYLDGGNGKDFLDGGPGTGDVCLGGNGNDTYVDCEVQT
jgi:predicted ribosomally synthesized peptide with SipW-like signal peptide